MVGAAPADPGYARVKRHEGWIGPWLEDDSMLIAPEIWVNRTVDRAKAAYSYGARGALMGTHWRTRAIAPNLHALLRIGLDVNLSPSAIWKEWCAQEFGAAAAPHACAAFGVLDDNNCSESLMEHKVSHVYARPSCMRPASWGPFGSVHWSVGPEGSVAVLRGNDTGYQTEDQGQCAWPRLYNHWCDPIVRPSQSGT
jgi:hypothetical protein